MTLIFDKDENYCDVFSPSPAIHLLNLPPGSRGRREQLIKTFRHSKYVLGFLFFLFFNLSASVCTRLLLSADEEQQQQQKEKRLHCA